MGDAKRRREHDPNYGQRPPVIDIRPDQSRDMFDNLPPGTTSDDYLKYLDQNWDVIATFAYNSYLREGRGALILDWDLSLDAHLALLPPDLKKLNSLDNRIVNRQLNCPIFYLGQRSAISQALGPDFFTTDIQRLIGCYDPEIMIVLFLCWGFAPDRRGHIMGRTLALANHKTPMQLYVDNADRQQEFSFFAGSNQATPPPPSSRVIRAFQGSVEHSPEFRQALRTAYDQGFQKHGKGAVLAIPDPSGKHIQPIFVPAAEVAQALGADIASRPFQQAATIIDICKPETQVAAIVVNEAIHTASDFVYYSFLMNISGGDCHE